MNHLYRYIIVDISTLYWYVRLIVVSKSQVNFKCISQNMANKLQGEYFPNLHIARLWTSSQNVCIFTNMPFSY